MKIIVTIKPSIAAMLMIITVVNKLKLFFIRGMRTIPRIAPTFANADEKPCAEARSLVGNNSAGKIKVVAFGPIFIRKLYIMKPPNSIIRWR